MKKQGVRNANLRRQNVGPTAQLKREAKAKKTLKELHQEAGTVTEPEVEIALKAKTKNPRQGVGPEAEIEKEPQKGAEASEVGAGMTPNLLIARPVTAKTKTLQKKKEKKALRKSPQSVKATKGSYPAAAVQTVNEPENLAEIIRVQTPTQCIALAERTNRPMRKVENGKKIEVIRMIKKTAKGPAVVKDVLPAQRNKE